MMISAENNEYLLTRTDTHTVTHTQMASWGSIIWESNHCACVLWVCQWQQYNTKIMNKLLWYMTSSRASGWMEWKKSVMDEDSNKGDASCIKLHIIRQGCEYMEGDNSIIFISLLFPRNKNVQTWGALMAGRPYWGFVVHLKLPLVLQWCLGKPSHAHCGSHEELWSSFAWCSANYLHWKSYVKWEDKFWPRFKPLPLDLY